MSRENEFAETLRHPEQAGVRHLAPEDHAVLEQAARALDFALFHVDLAGCADKSGLLSRIGAALNFPAWFGHNLDALEDCLGDMSWCPAAGYVIVFTHPEGLPPTARPDVAAVLDVFESAAREWARDDVAMWAFVSGHTDVGLPREA